MEYRGKTLDPGLVRVLCLVAKYGSVTAAVPHLGAGASRTAVSRKVSKLEAQLGHPVIDRSTHLLHPHGRELVDVYGPILRDLDRKVEKQRALEHPRLKIGGTQAFTHAHWWDIWEKLLAIDDRITYEVTNGTEEQLVGGVASRHLDLAIVPIKRELDEGLQSRMLLSLIMVLLVPAESDITSAEQLWGMPEIPCKLILPAASTTVVTLFQEKLHALGVTWDSRCSSPLSDLITPVARGKGIALSLLEPNLVNHPGVRALPLKHFPAVDVGVIWRAPASPLLKKVIALLARHAREVSPGLSGGREK